ncbi:MAG: hypothetical protein HZA10_07420 [Nitrospirae bacterium]|nr:hypothetical protein [Nitrospirota bacterium]
MGNPDFFKNFFDNTGYLFTETSAASKTPRSYKIPAAAGLLFLLVCLLFLELRDNYYFVQDDNLVQFLPTIIQGCRAFFEEGVFPTWNPYQIMGSPTSNLGVYSLTYPLTYISYFISETLFDNEYLTIEVFAFIHFILGYLAAVWMCRLSRMNPVLAVVASLCFIMSGYNFIIGRSWYYMLPVMLWLPLLAVSVIKFRRGAVSFKWILFTGVVIGMFFHSGNSQIWFYSLIFFFLSLGITIITQKIQFTKMLYIIPAFLFGLSIALILLIPTYMATADIPRSTGSGSEGVLSGVMAMLLPYPIAKGPHPIDQIYWYSNYSGLYYNGSFFNIISALSIAALIAGLAYYRKNCDYSKKLINDNVWLLMAVVAFLFALGNAGLLWPLFSNIPPFNKFKLPFKFLPFVNLFTILGGGLILERYLARKRINIYARSVVYILVLMLLFYNLTLCRSAIYIYGDKPYPALPEDVYRMLTAQNSKRPQRIYISAPYHSPDKDFLLSLPHNIPSIYRIPSIIGYEKLASEPSLGVDEFYQYGVKYVLVLNASTDLHAGGTPFPSPAYFDLKKITEFGRVELYELKNALPLAFLAQNKSSLPIKFTGRGAVIDVSGVNQPVNVTANIFYRKGMTATAEGKKLMIRPDEWNRILVLNCPPTKKLEIIYSPFWDKGFMMSGIFLLLSAVSWPVIRHLEGRKKI